MSENSDLNELSALVPQIMFLADLTVLRLITTVSAKISKTSYLPELSAQVSQVLFLANSTVLTLNTTV